jgi:hypothetical protein
MPVGMPWWWDCMWYRLDRSLLFGKWSALMALGMYGISQENDWLERYKRNASSLPYNGKRMKLRVAKAAAMIL